MTLDTYSHAIPGGGALTAAAMERALAPEEDEPENSPSGSPPAALDGPEERHETT